MSGVHWHMPEATGLRPVRDEDGPALMAVVAGCWAEYPGCVTDFEGEAPEYHALATHLARKGGAGWVWAQAGLPVGLVAVWPAGDGAWELGKMYVAAAARGTGAAATLAEMAEAHARARGAARIVLWSDTRFDRGHAFYERRGYVRRGAIRALADKSASIEFGFTKPVSGVVVEMLDAAAAASAERGLADVLVACVADGAAISFMPPLPVETARTFWADVSRAVAGGRRILLAGWVDGILAGTAQLDIGTPPNQPHRADLAKMMVHPRARRRGLGSALLAAAEAAAAGAGRSLLTLDTRADDAGEALYRLAGWTEAGRIPRYALNPDGTPHATVLFFKNIGGIPPIPDSPGGVG